MQEKSRDIQNRAVANAQLSAVSDQVPAVGCRDWEVLRSENPTGKIPETEFSVILAP